MMANMFENANYPQIEPKELMIGDRWAWKRTDLGADYSPALYTLTYEAVKYGEDETSLTITAAASGTDYVVEVASATTDDYVAGTYAWSSFITRDADSERLRLSRGTWLLVKDVADDTSDPRSFNQRMLEALEATIEGRASKSHSAYSIEGRSVTRLAPEELERWRGIYQHRVSVERNTDRVRAGKASAFHVHMKF